MISIPLRSVERAKLTINIADVCVVNIAINDIRHDFASPTLKRLALLPLPAMIGQLPKLI
jgi:hypothetical protein